MVIAIFGESCTGKSTLARALCAGQGAVYSGKDYLKLAKSEAEAARLFTALLKEKIDAPDQIAYVVAEREQLALLPEGCVRVYCTAPLDVIKARFSERMRGHMPPPVEKMLEKKHGCFDEEPYDLKVDTALSGAEDIRAKVDALWRGKAKG